MDIKKTGYYIIGSIILLFTWIIILYFLTPTTNVYDYFIRLAVLLGYTCLFLATLTTPFMKQLYQMFGKPFLKIHHLFSIAGLILITVHPVAFAIKVSDPAVLVPRFDSWIVFWNLAGRPALYLIYIAVLAVLLRKYMPQKLWRTIHGFNYVALVFAYFHGVLIGTDFQNLGIMITFTAMFIITFEVLIYKRYLKYRLKKK